jgi:hypothetical protein
VRLSDDAPFRRRHSPPGERRRGLGFADSASASQVAVIPWWSGFVDTVEPRPAIEIGGRSCNCGAGPEPSLETPRRALMDVRRECFCGCGRSLGWRDRGISKQGARVTRCLDFLKGHGDAVRALPRPHPWGDVDGLVERGELLSRELSEVIHGERRSQSVNRTDLKRWLSICQEAERRVAREESAPSRLTERHGPVSRGMSARTALEELREAADRLAEAPEADPVAQALATRAEELLRARRLESDVALEVAERYAKDVEHVDDEDEAIAVLDAIGRGFAVRAAVEETGDVRPLGEDLARRVANLPSTRSERVGALLRMALSLTGPGGWGDKAHPGSLFGAGQDAWKELESWAWFAGTKASRERTGGFAAGIEYARAFRFGYLVRALEQAALEAITPQVDERVLETARALFARPAELCTFKDIEAALLLGVTFGIDLEGAEEAVRDALTTVALAGFAYRRAEEATYGVGYRPLCEMQRWFDTARASVDADEWEVMYQAAWTVVLSDQAERPPMPDPDSLLTLDTLLQHSRRRAEMLERFALSVLVDELDPKRATDWKQAAKHAAAYGYVLRYVEDALPDDPTREFTDQA